MSVPHLPPELLDHVVNLLRGKKRVLRNCCLVSKSWIPRTRKHLFATIRFETERDLVSWKNTFPDPSTSPACHTETLKIGCSHAVTAADADVGGWIRGFSGVVDLEVGSQKTYADESEISLVPLYGFSPVVKSLRADFIVLPPSQMFDLILSFPLLEDLTVDNAYHASAHDGVGSGGIPSPIRPSNLPVPMLTGSLELSRGGVRPMAPRLLSLPDGIHFRKLILMQFHNEDLPLTTGLVEACSHTLESLDIIFGLHAGAESVLFDLSKATRLRDAAFRVTSMDVGWLIRTLQTITPEHRDFREISIDVVSYLAILPLGVTVEQAIGEKALGEWLDLDQLLVQLSKSSPARPRVVRMTSEGGGWNQRDCLGRLLPGMTRRGMVGLIE